MSMDFVKYATGSILGMAGQQIMLPLFLATLGGSTGIYFILLICCVLFNVVFWPIVAYRFKTGKIDIEGLKMTSHWKLILVGIFDALNGILIVYASVMNRTPGPLQAILGQSVIPFTMLLSIPILRKRYTGNQLIGAIITFFGIAISLIPVFMHIGKSNYSNFYWPIVFLIGNIPGVLMNIYEENIFRETNKRYDIYYLLAMESFYQLITILCLFWIDILPEFGTSHSMKEWIEMIHNGSICFFTGHGTSKCSISGIIGLGFAVSYCFSYIYGAMVMRHASANSNAFAISISPVIVVSFWMIFPSLNSWAGGNPYTKLDIICDLLALIPLVIGAGLFRYYETKQEKKDFYQDITHQQILESYHPNQTGYQTIQ
jgi:hypothetical protein